MYTYEQISFEKSRRWKKTRWRKKILRCTLVRDTRHRVEYVRLRASYEFN